MFTPPALFLSFGMPPASMPASCGADSAAPPPLPLPMSLLLRARFCDADGGGRRPGTGGAPPIGGPALAEEDLLSRMGAERSFTSTFLSRVPFWMSPRRAPCDGKVSVVCLWYHIRRDRHALFPSGHLPEALRVSRLVAVVEAVEALDLGQRIDYSIGQYVLPYLLLLQALAGEAVVVEEEEASWLGAATARRRCSTELRSTVHETICSRGIWKSDCSVSERMSAPPACIARSGRCTCTYSTRASGSAWSSSAWRGPTDACIHMSTSSLRSIASMDVTYMQ